MAVGRIRGVLFDKDGTLIDFRSQWLPAYRAAAEDLAAGGDGIADRLLLLGGWDTGSGRLDPASPLACGTNRQIVELWAGALGRNADEDLLVRVEAIFHRVATAAARPTVELTGLFGRIRAHGIAIGVATMDATRTAEANLEAFGIAHLVDFVVGADAGHGIKPDPGMLLAFCRRVGLVPAEVAMVGDAVVDLLMGRNARAGLVIGVTTGVTPREVLAPHADRVLESVAEIEAILAHHSGGQSATGR
jgi:phosphoglycolate phosphatase